MYGIAANSLADRFAWLIDGLCKAIGVDAQKRRMEAALAWAVWNRVRLLGERLIALAARVRAGRVPAAQTWRDTSPRPSPQSGEGEAEKPAASLPTASLLTASLPRAFGWVTQALPQTAQFAGVLQYMLRDPEMAALVEKAPRAGRHLRLLCHLLGVKAPEFLRTRVGDGVAPAPRATPEEPEAPLAVGAQIAVEAPRTVEVPRTAQAPPVAEAAQASSVPATAQGTTPAPRPYHLRPGGLYWDGRRWQWS